MPKNEVCRQGGISRQSGPAGLYRSASAPRAEGGVRNGLRGLCISAWVSTRGPAEPFPDAGRVADAAGSGWAADFPARVGFAAEGFRAGGAVLAASDAWPAGAVVWGGVWPATATATVSRRRRSPATSSPPRVEGILATAVRHGFGS
jgi:hypothetical protein